MKTLQKTTWMRFIRIGISIFIFISSCGKTANEYRMNLDLVFFNSTDSLISFKISERISYDKWITVKIPSHTQSKIFSYEYDGVNKEITPQNCCQSFLPNVFSIREFNNGSSKKIFINDSLCVVHLNEKSTEILNYTSEIISDRHFKYKYIFTHRDIKNAHICK